MRPGAFQAVHAGHTGFCVLFLNEVPWFYPESPIAKNQNTYAKRQREQEKKQRANDKRAKRDRKNGVESTAAPFQRFFTRPINPADDD